MELKLYILLFNLSGIISHIFLFSFGCKTKSCFRIICILFFNIKMNYLRVTVRHIICSKIDIIKV
uniref:Uncharacterized protein n=1 Tax=Anguilla anguilla TaxID=7936 RepID=A0A0E9WXL9_ANGAN